MIAIIAAMGKNRVIGKGNAIPWHLPADLQRFRELTWGSSLIMGRRTFESIGRPLPGRRTILLTRQAGYHSDVVEIAASLPAAFSLAADENIFVCGGTEVYQAALQHADRIYLTVVDCEPEGDTFFPEIPPSFLLVSDQPLQGNLAARWQLYERTEVA